MTVSDDLRRDLAPTGVLRAAINFGNQVLAQRDAVSGEARGVSVDLANIEGGYMVRTASPFNDIRDVDRPGIRVTVASKSAY